MTNVIIHTDSNYLLDFVDKYAIRWLERKWRKKGDVPVVNVKEWRELLMAREDIDVKWVCNISKYFIK